MSKLPFELLLALRYLRPKRTFVSIITLVSIVGVALGVAVLIIVISVMSGFDHDLRQQILGFQPHITVRQLGTPMGNYGAVAEQISKNKNVLGVTPFVAGPVLAETQGDTNRPAYQDTPALYGVDPKETKAVSELPKKVIFGEFDLSGHGMVVGGDFANNMHLQIGDHLSIYSADEIKRMKAAYDRKEYEAILPDDYEIRGIYSTGYYDYDAHVIIVSLDNAQDLYDLSDSVHGLQVTIKDPYQAYSVKDELEQMLGDNYEVTTWMEGSHLLDAVKVEKEMMFYLMFFIVLVAALCILSAQITFVIQKTREIGMLKALGASSWQISGIFLFQSAVIGVIGVSSGLAFGMLALKYRNQFLHLIRQITHQDIFPADIYGFGGLPSLTLPTDMAVICIVSFIICLLGGLLPAWRAGRLQPVEALRYE